MQQCCQRVTGRVHPGPGFGVREIVVELDGAAQMPVCHLMRPLMIGKLAVKERRADV